MKYKGIELKEVTEPQLFNPPKRMLVWDNYEKVELDVYAIVSRRDFPVICENSTWKHCAEIPEEPKKLVTYRELARWIAEGKGEMKLGEYSTCQALLFYAIDNENKAVRDGCRVRKWDETEWHKPTREYLGLEDK